jgi:quinol-cytochrome oxidoreductase complex cytochrome b subunit
MTTSRKTTQPSKQNKKAPEPGNTPLQSSLSMIARFQRFGLDFLGVSILAFSLMTLLALLVPELTRGLILSLWRRLIMEFLGWGSILVVIAGGVSGMLLLQRTQQSCPPSGAMEAHFCPGNRGYLRYCTH